MSQKEKAFKINVIILSPSLEILRYGGYLPFEARMLDILVSSMLNHGKGYLSNFGLGLSPKPSARSPLASYGVSSFTRVSLAYIAY